MIATELKNTAADKTKARIIAAAERLIAERGIDGVSLNEINRSAGQKNATALHYHFGGKEGLMQAIYDKHTLRVEAVRRRMLEDIPEEPDLRSLVELLIVPIAEQIKDEDGGIYYLQFQAQVLNNPVYNMRQIDKRENKTVEKMQSYFSKRLTHLTPEVQFLRVEFAMRMIFNALSAYGSKIMEHGWDADYYQFYIRELITVATAVYAEP